MDRQRIDKWLWHARVVRARATAAELADGGRVRVNGVRIDVASRAVRPGDVVTIALDRVRILKVLGFSERRGAAPTARMLYEDLTPPASVSGDRASQALRGAGTGRPTKRGRKSAAADLRSESCRSRRKPRSVPGQSNG